MQECTEYNVTSLLVFYFRHSFFAANIAKYVNFIGEPWACEVQRLLLDSYLCRCPDTWDLVGHTKGLLDVRRNCCCHVNDRSYIYMCWTFKGADNIVTLYSSLFQLRICMATCITVKMIFCFFTSRSLHSMCHIVTQHLQISSVLLEPFFLRLEVQVFSRRFKLIWENRKNFRKQL